MTLVESAQADQMEKHYLKEQYTVVKNTPTANFSNKFQKLAKAAQQNWIAKTTASFRPECLTLYLSNLCNLGCKYCFAANIDGSRMPLEKNNALNPLFPILNIEQVKAAAQIVAKNCSDKKLDFKLVIHGGGEPTLHWNLLKEIVHVTKAIAKAHNIGWWGYIATNGIFPAEHAKWLALNFDLIGLSVDGPPDIQNKYRPKINGATTADLVKETAKIFNASKANYKLRTTIHPDNLVRQTEIFLYLYQQFSPQSISFEPVYQSGRGINKAFTPRDATAFVSHFLATQKIASNLNLSLIHISEPTRPY